MWLKFYLEISVYHYHFSAPANWSYSLISALSLSLWPFLKWSLIVKVRRNFTLGSWVKRQISRYLDLKPDEFLLKWLILLHSWWIFVCEKFVSNMCVGSWVNQCLVEQDWGKHEHLFKMPTINFPLVKMMTTEVQYHKLFQA